MTNTFLFYDIETSGLNKTYDQVLQFAAIRTDLQLKIIEKHDILIKVSKDTIIDPVALTVHQLSPDFCNQGIDEYTAILKIHTLMNTPGTISIGYNTLGFDDEFLRFKFHQHLLQPYTHQYANNCYRADLYPMLIMYYLFNPEIIKWPDNKSMKLEDINAANCFTDKRSHTALADVEATIGIADKMMQNKTLWQYLLGYFNKQEYQKRLQELGKYSNNFIAGILVDGAFGWDNQFSTSIYYLGRHKNYKNQTIWLNLGKNFNLETIEQNQQDIDKLIIRKKDAEPGFIIPINRASKLWDDNNNQQLAINFLWCKNNQTILKAIADHYTTQTYADIENCDPAADLYQAGFPDNRSIDLQNEFWQQNWEQKLEMLTLLPKNKQILGERIIWRYRADLIKKPSRKLVDYFEKLHGILPNLEDYKQQQFRNYQEVDKLIDELLVNKNITTKNIKLLKDYKLWLDKNFAKIKFVN